MLHFGNIEWLWLLLAVPVVTIFYFLWLRNKHASLKQYIDAPLISLVLPDYSSAKLKFRFIVLMLSFVFVILSLAEPREGSKLQEVKRSGIDLMICLDVSNSMLAEDLRPNRLENAKRAISKLIDDLKGDRIGLIIFGGEAYVQLPMTTDYAAAKMFLSTVSPDLIPTQGTAIGSALELAGESFPKESKNKKAIVLITDGENHEDDAVQLASNLNKEQGILIYTIGMGSPEGTPIPLYQNGRPIGFKKDNQGNTVVTKLNETSLLEIAGAANGVYVRAGNGDTGLDIIYEKINSLEKTDYQSKLFVDYEDRYQYFVAIALIFLVLEMMFSNKRSKWVKSLGLSEEK